LQAETQDQPARQRAEAKKIGAAAVVDLSALADTERPRLRTGLEEVDRVLGGGLFPGSLVLLGGEPGIGKSTLVAQIAGALEKSRSALYASGEESAAQVKARLTRLGSDFSRLKFISETNIEKIVATARQLAPDILIIDSIQTVYSSLMPAEAGSLNQIRAAAVKLLELAKGSDIAIFLIGHITKDGQIAGPKSLEHIVDTVLYLEVEAANNYCLLRAAKNRFGSVNELGILEMTGSGFKEVKNPSAVFLETGAAAISGAVIGCVLEGSRPFLVEIQALVSKTAFGYPQRKASGFDLNRLQVLSAVIAKRTKINLVSQDIILNVVGGLRLADPSLDLAACAAIIASYRNQSLDRRMVVLGEVGLGGEVRPVHKLETRLQEAARLGFKAAIVPALAPGATAAKPKAGSLQVSAVRNLTELAEIIG
jgi:DNA repair protein RadA/Sms